MKQGLLFCILAICLFSFAINAYADPISNSFGANVTLFDKWGTQPLSGPGEDNEVEPPDLNEQSWDLEGFFLKGNILTLIGGFDFKNGGADPYRPGNTYISGDIFIGTDVSAVKYGSDISGSYSRYQEVSNSFGYNYAIRLNFGANNIDTYTVYQINSTSTLLVAPYFTENSKASPWQYLSGGISVATGSFDYQTGLTDAQTGLLGGNHNAISVDLSTFLESETDFISHFTMGCGNDLVMGQGLTAPEPSTLMLLGSGLITAAVLRKRKAQTR
jgi:hypothetical protein